MDSGEEASPSGRRELADELSEPNRLSPSQLLVACVGLYSSFNPAQFSLDAHADECISHLAGLAEDDETFIRQVFYGVVRYRKLLNSFMDTLHYYRTSSALREDAVLHRIVAYLAIFRLEELGLDAFVRLLDSQTPQQTMPVLSLLFDRGLLEDTCRQEWLKLYDKGFVDDLVAGLVGRIPAIKDYITRLEAHVTKAQQAKEAGFQLAAAGRKTTVAQPFAISQPKPKPLPAPVRPPSPFRAKPAPRTAAGPTKEQRAIEAASAAHRKEFASLLSDPKHQPFKLRVDERPVDIEKLRAEIEEERRQRETLKPFAGARERPATPSAEVRLNVAAIFREDALYRKRQAEEAEMLKRYEQELRDPREYENWLAEQRAALQAQDEERAAALKREVEETKERARQAEQKAQEDNLAAARAAKEAAAAALEALSQEMAAQLAANRERAEQIMADRARVEAAGEQLVAHRKAAAEDIRSRMQEDAKREAERQARELAERRDLILQLRALERVPKPRIKILDPTDAPDHGLLEQMSLHELRARLAAMKERLREEEERARAGILTQKAEREAMILAKVANLQAMRKTAAQQAAARKTTQAAVRGAAAEEKRVAYEGGALKLHDKMDAAYAAKAAEAARLAAEEKRQRFERMQNKAGAFAVEAAAFEGLRDGAKRELLERQNVKLKHAERFEQTRRELNQNRDRNAREQAKEKTAFLAKYDEQLKLLEAGAAAVKAADEKRILDNARAQHAHEVTRRADAERTRYRPSSSTMTQTQAKLLALGRGELI